MIFKEESRQKLEWWQVDPRLRQILCEIEVMAHPFIMTITELLRSDSEQAYLFSVGASPARTSVHQFGRGADFRPFPNENLNSFLLDYVNKHHPYDPNRDQLKTLIREAKTEDHFHLQVISIEDWTKLNQGGSHDELV